MRCRVLDWATAYDLADQLNGLKFNCLRRELRAAEDAEMSTNQNAVSKVLSRQLSALRAIERSRGRRALDAQGGFSTHAENF